MIFRAFITNFNGLSMIRLGLSFSLISLIAGLLPDASFLFSNDSITLLSFDFHDVLMSHPALVLWLLIVFSICLGFGYFQKSMTAFIIATLMILLNRNPFFSWGNTQFLIQLFLIYFATLFFASRNRNSFLYLAWGMHIPLVYLSTGLSRIGSSSWHDGSAALFTLKNHAFSYFLELDRFLNISWFKLMTWSVVLIELLCIAAFFLPKKVGKSVLLAAILMHCGFFLTIKVQNWQSIMLTLLIFGFVHFEIIQTALKKLASTKYTLAGALLSLYFALNILIVVSPHITNSVMNQFSFIGRSFYHLSGLSGPAALTMFQNSEPEIEICFSLQFQDKRGHWNPLFGPEEGPCDKGLRAAPGNEKNLYFRRLVNWKKLNFDILEFQNEFALSVCQALRKKGTEAFGVRLRQTVFSYEVLENGSLEMKQPFTKYLLSRPCFDPS